MVQALAFAEIFLGLILADAGYKGVSLSAVVKGEAGKEVAPAPLGSSTTSKSSSGGGGGEAPFSVPAAVPGTTLPTLAPGTGGPGAFNWPAGTVAEALKFKKEHPNETVVPK
jgi:hypothetical protein